MSPRAEGEGSRPARRLLRALAVVYLAALVASQLWWRVGGGPGLPEPTAAVLELPAVEGGEASGPSVRLVHTDSGAREAGAPTLLLLHGSPGSRHPKNTVQSGVVDQTERHHAGAGAPPNDRIR